MNYQVTRVEFAGQPNQHVWVRPDLDDSIERRIKDLQPPDPDDRVRSIRCWPNRSGRTLFIYRFFEQSPMGTNLSDGSLIYVLGNRVQFDDDVRVDASGDLEKWALEAMASGDRVRAVPCRLCAPSEPAGTPFRCPCDNPIDLSPWNLDAVIDHNNCYSFARRARWCAGGGGSQPGNQESGDETQIRAGLVIDGLVPATEAEVLRGNGTNGTFVAFLLKGTLDYHFLRLDGDRWTHMPKGHPAIACDADGRPIRKDGVRLANMLEYRFRDYYRIPPNTPLTHCS